MYVHICDDRMKMFFSSYASQITTWLVDSVYQVVFDIWTSKMPVLTQFLQQKALGLLFTLSYINLCST